MSKWTLENADAFNKALEKLEPVRDLVDSE